MTACCGERSENRGNENSCVYVWLFLHQSALEACLPALVERRVTCNMSVIGHSCRGCCVLLDWCEEQG